MEQTKKKLGIISLCVRALLIDASASGVSGDMLSAALLDLGAEHEVVRRLAASLPSCLEGLTSVNVNLEKVARANIAATTLKLEIVENRRERSITDFYASLDELRRSLNLSSYVYSRAKLSLEYLERAERRIHGDSKKHLHELASADTLFDVVLAPLLVESLGLGEGKVFATPVATGRGSVKIAHGVVSIPAPAVKEILVERGIPFKLGPVEGELATPTGVALLAALADEFVSETPPLKVLRLGYGAGSMDYGTQPLSVAEVYVEGDLQRDKVVVLETNVDDVDGELLAYARDLLIERGALDVLTIPATGKRGRPAFLVQVLTEPGRAVELANLLMVELGTLGVRFSTVERVKLKREVREIEYQGEKVRVKLAYGGEGKLVRAKPEYVDLERLAKRLGLSLRELREKVLEKLYSSG